jgi:hypothetical protein
MFPFAGLLTGISTVYQAIGGTQAGSEDSPVDAYVTLLYDSDGGVRFRYTTPTNVTTINKTPWSSLEPDETDGANWHIRITHSSETNQYNSGAGLGSWLPLSSNRFWKFLKSGVGSNSGTYLVELSDDAGSSVYDSASFIANLTVETP